MLRTQLVIVLVPAGLLAWLALGTHSEPADDVPADSVGIDGATTC